MTQPSQSVIFRPLQARFSNIPQAPLCYWLAAGLADLLSAQPPMGRGTSPYYSVVDGMNTGAKQVMIPTVNAPDLGSIPTELLDKTRIEFFSEPIQAAYKALAEV